MKIIEKTVVASTWKEVAALNENTAKQRMVKLGARQTDLLSFVTTAVEELKQDVLELGVYIFYVVYRMFEKSCKTKLKRISSNKIAAAYEKNETLLLTLDGSHNDLYAQIANIEITKQPHVIRYVLDTLFETDEDPEPITLSDVEIGTLFLILKTVVDVLGNAGK